jgi:hypothetical protein
MAAQELKEKPILMSASPNPATKGGTNLYVLLEKTTEG